jgi:hypothetical protein
MKVQKLGWVAIGLVAMVCAPVSAADRPSQATLAAMGLSGMSVMSDVEALNIRGMGFSGHSKKGKGKSKSSARAWGSSFARVSGHGAEAGSQNGYDSQGRHFAAGANLSFAGKLIVSGGGGGGGGDWGGDAAVNGGGGHGGHGGKPRVKAVVVFAGGGSIAVND